MKLFQAISLAENFRVGGLMWTTWNRRPPTRVTRWIGGLRVRLSDQTTSLPRKGLKMGAEAGSSLLMHVGLLGFGYVLGRVQLLPLLVELYYELFELSTARKALLAGSLFASVVVYAVFMLLPLRKIADTEARAAQAAGATASPTSFRRELRRRGSYSMSYVTDIKAHVFARTETL